MKTELKKEINLRKDHPLIWETAYSYEVVSIKIMQQKHKMQNSTNNF